MIKFSINPYVLFQILTLSFVFQSCLVTHKYNNGDPDIYYSTIDKVDINGIQQGFWTIYRNEKFKPINDKKNARYQELVYFRNGVQLLSKKYNLHKGYQKNQIVPPIITDKYDNPILLSGTYKFMSDDYKNLHIDLCYTNGILQKVMHYDENRVTNTTFIIYNHDTYGTISYSVYFEKDSIPNDFWITKLIDRKHWKVIKRSERPLLDIRKFDTCR